MFDVGDKVVCVDAGNLDPSLTLLFSSIVEEGWVYIVEENVAVRDGYYGIRVLGITSTPEEATGLEPCWKSKRFRKIDWQKLDVSKGEEIDAD